MKRSLLLLTLLPLAACTVEGDWRDFDLRVSPFRNAHVAEGIATLEIVTADGYLCPDGSDARIYLVVPDQDEAPFPLAVMFHGRNLDYVDDLGGHYEAMVDKLTLRWASGEVERMLGIQGALDDVGQNEGAWIAALLARGYAVAAPTNCWGDLWHGHSDNPWDEGFLRMGAYLADEAVRIAQARDDIGEDGLLAIGLSEGGRAVTELILGGTQPAGVIIDSSPDWLPPLLATGDSRYLDGLRRIYDAELRDFTSEEEPLRTAALGSALARDSMTHVIADLGFRAPILYAWSSQDQRFNPSISYATAETIQSHYPPEDQLVWDWRERTHAPSNRQIEDASAGLDFVLSRLQVPSI